MFMPHKKISAFKGIAEHIDPTQLSDGLAQNMYNLDVDKPLGALSLRDGYTKKYSETYTSILSSYEYELENGDVILIFNDNGTFKYYKNGTYIGSLTLPGGSAVATDFTHQYLGWKNSIRVTTGSGATNHILWFGETDRDETDNNGLFGDVLGDSGTPDYRLLRSQLIPVSGSFSDNVNSIAYLNGSYYVSYNSSLLIEKRNSDFLLEDKWFVNEDSENIDVSGGTYVSLSAGATTLYVGVSGGTYEINPYTHKILNEETTVTAIKSIANDGTHIYSLSNGGFVNKILISSFSSIANQGGFSTTAIACDSTASTGELYVSDTSAVVSQLNKSDLTAITHTYDLTTINGSISSISGMALKSGSLFVSCLKNPSGDVDSYIADLDASDVSTLNTSYLKSGFQINTVFLDADSNVRCQDDSYGVIVSPTAATIYTDMVSITADAYGLGDLGTGTYYYKYAIEDVDGQIYTMSDAIRVTVTGGAGSSYIRLCACGDRSQADVFEEFYRIRKIHIYRSFSEGDSEESEYSLLKTVDINDRGWENDSTYNIYYFDYTDNTVQSEISSTTYEEMSGISDNTKPRFVNGKYFTWVDNQLHLANIYSDGEGFPSQIVKSGVNAPDSIALYDTYKFQGHGGEIKGISNLFGRTVVFKEREGAFYYNNTLADAFEPGISSDRGYVKVDDVIYYDNIRGVYILASQSSQMISDPIRGLHNDASQAHSEATMFYHDALNRLIISYGSGDYSFVYSIAHKTWVPYTNFYFRNFFKNSSSQYIGANATNFQLLFDGFATDDSTPINIYWKSGVISFEADGFDNEVTQLQRRITINVTTAGTIKIYNPNGTLLKTVTLSDVSTDYTVITDFLSGLWCEGIIVEISSDVSEFLLSQMVFKHNVIGETVG